MIYRNNCSSRLAFLSLSFLFLFGSELDAQPTRDPQQDLTVKFSTKRSGDDPGTVVGSVKNRSANAYACVRVEFDLLTRFDLRTPGEKAQHLGVLPVEVQNLVPHGERDFQQPLSFPAGVGVKSVRECSAQPTKEPPTKEPPTKEPPTKEPPAPRPPTPKPPAPGQGETSPPPPPAPPATCSLTGRISGKLKWDTKDDRGQPVSFTLTHMFLRAPGTARPEHVEVQGRKYTFNKVPAGKSYNISAGSFRSEPREKTVSCRPGSTHVGIDFKITGPPPSG